MTNEQIAAELERLANGKATEDEGYITTLDLTRFVRARLPAILRALREPTAEQVERAAVALYKSMRAPHEIEWETEEEWLRDSHRNSAKAVLLAARSAP